MEINVFDVGHERYGDCLFVTEGNKSILIDGAHPDDDSCVISQLQMVLGTDPPYKIDLLVVTHCHTDHIGCLPSLVKDEKLKFKHALVADEKLGWPVNTDGRSLMDAVKSERERMLIAALLEEDRSNLSEPDLLEFLQDAADMELDYKDMLEKLEADGTKILRYTGPNSETTNLESTFSAFGMKILGPTEGHLNKCADSIVNSVNDFVTTVQADLAFDSPIEEIVETYRRLTNQATDSAAIDGALAGAGAARNNQSIVLSLASGGWKALLAGDMQFAKPEVTGLGPDMKALRMEVVQNGAYDFIKLTHHTAENGVSAAVLDQWLPTTLFAHTGGLNDPKHPDKDVLELLKTRARTHDLTFARTDRNRLIKVAKVNGNVTLIPQEGKLNDFTPNVARDVNFELNKG